MTKKKCSYCGSTWNPEKDHIKAKSKGGITTTNACQSCNRSKSIDSHLSWLRRLKKNKEYRWTRIKDYQKGKRNEFANKVRKVANEK